MKRYLLTASLLLGVFVFLSSQVTIGDATNYTEIEDDGTIEFNGTATVWNDYVVPLSSAKARGTKFPGYEAFMDDGAGSTGVWAYAFDAGAEEELSFTVQMPHSWNGTIICPHLHWSPANDNSGSVVWGIEYTWIEYNSSTPNTFPATTIETKTAAITTSDHKHLITEFTGITPSSDQDNISSILVMRLFRDATNGSDDYNSDAFGLSFDLHYEINTVGSRQEHIK